MVATNLDACPLSKLDARPMIPPAMITNVATQGHNSRFVPRVRAVIERFHASRFTRMTRNATSSDRSLDIEEGGRELDVVLPHYDATGALNYK